MTHATSYGRAVVQGETIGKIIEDRKRGDQPFYQHLVMEETHGPRGTVVDSAGKPVPNANVHVFVASKGKSGYSQLGFRYANPDGTFEFGPTAAGDRYMLVVGSNDLSKGLANKVRAFVEAPSGDAGSIVLPQGHSIKGTLRDEQGRPIANRQVVASEIYGSSTEHQPLSQDVHIYVLNYGSAVTNESGVFEIANLAQGVYDVKPTPVSNETGGEATSKIYLAKRVEVIEKSNTPSIELKPTQAVVVEARIKSELPPQALSVIIKGSLGSTTWQTIRTVQHDARVEVIVPRELADATIELLSTKPCGQAECLWVSKRTSRPSSRGPIPSAN